MQMFLQPHVLLDVLLLQRLQATAGLELGGERNSISAQGRDVEGGRQNLIGDEALLTFGGEGKREPTQRSI